jgi:putative phosphoribosyl transferase
MNGAGAAGAAVIRLHAGIPVGPGLYGDLTVPAEAIGVTLFAHGSGSSRFSPRNRLVADALNRRGIATLLFDLLTPAEEPHRANVFGVDLLGGRLELTTRWLLEQPLAEGLAPCFFGASTGAAAALTAAANLGPLVRAVVSRGGRPDLAGTHLPRVDSPTLLIVGEDDPVVVDLNRQAFAALTCERRLVIIRRAGHLFEEPGTLERVAELSGAWLAGHLTEPRVEATAHGEVEIVDPVVTGA